MLYAVDMWGNPHNRKGTLMKQRMMPSSHLAKIQRQALLSLGPMRSTAPDTLEVHTDLLPFHLLVDKPCLTKLMRLATLPDTHPIYQHLMRVHKCTPRHHQAPI